MITHFRAHKLESNEIIHGETVNEQAMFSSEDTISHVILYSGGLSNEVVKFVVPINKSGYIVCSGTY